MFTGLITHLGTLERALWGERSSRLWIASELLGRDGVVGESVAVDGICLTVVELVASGFAVDLSPETLACTTAKEWAPGQVLHLERALRPIDRLGGHWVLGHVDGVGHLLSRTPDDNAVHMAFRAPQHVGRYLTPKGCIAVDGTSLTTNGVGGPLGSDVFTVTLIPHTLERTHFSALAVGAPVNLEADVIGKYVFEHLNRLGSKDSDEARDH